MTLIDYEKAVKNMAKNQTNDLADNDTVNHAYILVSELVKTAEKTIRLYTNSFCEEFYENEKILEAFRLASDNKVKFNIISENNISKNKAYIEYKAIFKQDNIQNIQNSQPITAEINSKEVVLNNFMTIDNKGIRYEQEKKDDICNNIKNIRARGTFNRPDDVEPFVVAFDIAFNNNN